MGWTIASNEYSPDAAMNKLQDGNIWFVKFSWNDAFIERNNLGLSIRTAKTHRDDSGYDDPLAWEAFYEVTVNDSISITPAVFNIEKMVLKMFQELQ